MNVNYLCTYFKYLTKLDTTAKIIIDILLQNKHKLIKEFSLLLSIKQHDTFKFSNQNTYLNEC